jgi:hypothetical protein
MAHMDMYEHGCCCSSSSTTPPQPARIRRSPGRADKTKKKGTQYARSPHDPAFAVPASPPPHTHLPTCLRIIWRPILTPHHPSPTSAARPAPSAARSCSLTPQPPRHPAPQHCTLDGAVSAVTRTPGRARTRYCSPLVRLDERAVAPLERRLQPERAQARRGVGHLAERAVHRRQRGAVQAAHLAAGLAVVLLQAPVPQGGPAVHVCWRRRGGQWPSSRPAQAETFESKGLQPLD